MYRVSIAVASAMSWAAWSFKFCGSGEQDGTNCPKRVSNLQMYRTRLSLNVDKFATDIKNDSLPKYKVIQETNKENQGHCRCCK